LIVEDATATIESNMEVDMRGERLNHGLSVITCGAGSDLVFLPGLGQRADLSVQVPTAVAGSARAVALGYRRTVHLIHRPVDMATGTTMTQLAAWHATALRERFGEPVDISGASGGGATALQLVLDHPDLVRRLVISVAGSRVSDRGRHDVLRIIERERQGKTTAWMGSGLVARGPVRLLTAAVYALHRGQPRAPGEAAFINAMKDWDVTDRLGEIRAPTLIICGTRDPLIPADIARATARGIPNGRLLLLPGRGHLTTLFDPRATEAARAFLDEDQQPRSYADGTAAGPS
jgi:pimeloyl-ACP methyl ester carboxylesterase